MEAPPVRQRASSLAQVGAHAGAAFTERIAELDLTPAQSGLVRLVASGPGQSQQALAHSWAPRRRGWSLWSTAWRSAAWSNGAATRRTAGSTCSNTEDGRRSPRRQPAHQRPHRRATEDERATHHTLLVKLADDQGQTPWASTPATPAMRCLEGL